MAFVRWVGFLLVMPNTFASSFIHSASLVKSLGLYKIDFSLAQKSLSNCCITTAWSFFSLMALRRVRNL